MISYRSIVALFTMAVLLSSTAVASRVHQAPTSGHRSHARTSRSTASRTQNAPAAHSRKTSSRSRRSSRSSAQPIAAHRSRGQQAITSERVEQIQQALIREHYLTGEASGSWDSETASAMQKYQADQGWQTKLMPDSRALKKLGLGPDYSNAINATGKSFTEPPQHVGSITPEQSSAFTAASGVRQ